MQAQRAHPPAQAGRRSRSLTVAALATLLAGLLVLVLDGHGTSWLAGLIAGVACGACGAWAALAPSHVGRHQRVRIDLAEASEPGISPAARAERRTAEVVASLERAGWCVLHDVRGRDATYDHVAVGPGGVILMQSIDPQGTVTMRAGEPFVARPGAPGTTEEIVRLRPRALTDASAFRDDVLRVAGRRLWVQAVVVLWSEFPAGVVADGRCAYVHGSRLAGWLARRPHQLSAADAEGVLAAVALTARIDSDLPLPVAV